MPPVGFLFGSMLPWLATLRMTLLYWEAITAAFPSAQVVPKSEAMGRTVVLFPTRLQRRAEPGFAGGQLLQFAPLRPNKARRYPSR